MTTEELKQLIIAGLCGHGFSEDSVDELAELLALHYPQHTIALLCVQPS